MNETPVQEATGRPNLRLVMLSAIFALLLFGSTAHADKRVALVIGNSAYQNTATLSNPINDSADVATALQKIGFTVLLEQDLDKRGMERAIARFARLAQNADAALFYYAGHGMQYRGSNYLVPVDAKLQDEFSLTFELTRLDDVLFGLERARGVKILILDACRDNPLADHLTQTASSRDLIATHGLAKIEASRGMVIAYSTQADQVAIDGKGRNSPFAAALVKEIAEPGVEIGAMFRRVAADVNTMTQGQQLPELSVSLIGDFYLNTHDTDVQAWAKVRASDNVENFKEFIAQFPNSSLDEDAHDRLAALESAQKERLAKEEAEREQQAKEQAEQDRLAAKQAEYDRLEKEQQAKEQAERNRVTQKQADPTAAANPSASTPPVPQDKLPTQTATAAKDAESPKPNPSELVTAGSDKTPTQTAMLAPPEAPSPKPVDMPPRSALVETIKKELTRVGCYSGNIDDNWSSAETKSSIERFVKYAHLETTSDDPADELLDSVRAKSGRVCPPECDAREIERNGKCVVKSCRSGAFLNVEGICERKVHEETTLHSSAESTPRRSVASLAPTVQSNGHILMDPGILSREPPRDTMNRNQIVLVDDGTCPRGQIKRLFAGIKGVRGSRKRACVQRR